jgi:biotin operon repressor
MNYKEFDMLPKDPVILLSYVNTQLRDNYSSLDALSEGLDLSKEDLNEVIETLKKAGYEYLASQNKFV